MDDGKTELIDTIFNHMTDGVLAQFTKYTSKDSLIITKEYRDAHPFKEISRGVNAKGEQEYTFDQPLSDEQLMVWINFDPNLSKDEVQKKDIKK